MQTSATSFIFGMKSYNIYLDRVFFLLFIYLHTILLLIFELVVI